MIKIYNPMSKTAVTCSGFFQLCLIVTVLACFNGTVYSQAVYTFTNAGATGRTGPTQLQVNAAYSGSSLAGAVTINTQGIQEWTVPVTGNYTIAAYGAQGARSGGLGAAITGTFSLTQGSVIKIVVGQMGIDGTTSGTTYTGGGGGGGTFVMKSPYNNAASILVIAGGGGGLTNYGSTTSMHGQSGNNGGSTYNNGGGTNGSGGNNGISDGPGAGGGGLLTNGTAGDNPGITPPGGGLAFVNGSAGGISGYSGSLYGGDGGFGGGGGAYNNTYTRSGGGGGYSGGQGGGWTGQQSGGGGGSYNSGTSQTNTSGARSGHGQVVITFVPGGFTFAYIGSSHAWTVPAGVSSINIEAWGAQGGTETSGMGYYGGYGGYSKGDLAVTPGQTIYFYVGGQGTGVGNSVLGGGGWNGGGHAQGSGDGGGGASDVRVGGTNLENRIVVAGGGGGNGYYSYAGGAGGGTTGSAGGNAINGSAAYGGSGGTQSDGGTGSGTYPGSSGALGVGGDAGIGPGLIGYSGGGGGGYYGGAGGAGCIVYGTGYGAAGGGGSSYIGGVTNGTTTAGLRSGNGQIIISYTIVVGPTISTSGTLSSFTSCAGTASAEQNFTASGLGLTANITVTAPTGFELSTTSGGSFSSPLTLTQTGGSVASTTIYVRMAASATGTPSGNITLTSTGATTQNVAVSGTVSSSPVVNAGVDQTISTATATLAGSISGSASTGTWSGGTGTYSPNNTSLTATYTPTAAERLAGALTLTLSSADPEGPCGNADDEMTLTFTSADKISIADGDWETDANWSPAGVPTLIDNVRINHTVTVNSSLADDPAICNDLAINSGKLLTVASGKALTVKGGLSNPASATITVVSGGSLITNGSISNNGTINIQRTITKDRWHLISSPVTDATAQVFEDDYLQSWSEVNAAWTDIISTGTALNPVQGYGLWTMYSSDHTYTFTGTPNTGNQEIPLTVSSNFPDPGPGYDGANLLGNPYPSAIDWSMLDNTYGAVYYWQGNGTNGDGTYLTWNNGSGDGSQYIAPAQGFFVVAASAGTFSLTNAHRTHSVGSYYKSASDTKDNLLVLETVSKGISDKLYVNFDTEASEDFELQYDAYKFPSGTAGLSELYSYADDKKLSIDVRPESELVQLGFANSLSGTYSIGINQVNGISKATLEDTKTNTFSDLLKGAYSFSYQAGESDQRFKLHMGTVGFEEKTETLIAQVYAADSRVYVRMKDVDLYTHLSIYDLSGRLVSEKTLTRENIQSFGMALPSGVYLVRLRGNWGIASFKVIL